MLCAKRRRWTQWHTVACAMFATALKFVSSLSLRLILFLVCIVHMLVPLVRARCLMHFIHRMCVCVCVCVRARVCACTHTGKLADPKFKRANGMLWVWYRPSLLSDWISLDEIRSPAQIHMRTSSLAHTSTRAPARTRSHAHAHAYIDCVSLRLRARTQVQCLWEERERIPAGSRSRCLLGESEGNAAGKDKDLDGRTCIW